VRQLVVGDSVMNSYAYTAWGVPLQWHERILNRYTYTSREYNPETHLYHYRLREYSPVIGRFHTRDIRAWDDPTSYAYCLMSPLQYVDPFGETVWIIIGWNMQRVLNDFRKLAQQFEKTKREFLNRLRQMPDAAWRTAVQAGVVKFRGRVFQGTKESYIAAVQRERIIVLQANEQSMRRCIQQVRGTIAQHARIWDRTVVCGHTNIVANTISFADGTRIPFSRFLTELQMAVMESLPWPLVCHWLLTEYLIPPHLLVSFCARRGRQLILRRPRVRWEPWVFGGFRVTKRGWEVTRESCIDFYPPCAFVEEEVVPLRGRRRR